MSPPEHGAAAVVVVGSANVDHVVRVPRRPGVGETVVGRDLAQLPGGKGANQAVAAARSGSATALVAAVGRDPGGDLLLEALAAAGVDTAAVARRPGPSGSAVIVVGPDADNSIIIVAGANARVDAAAVADADELLAGASVCVLQGELPSGATTAAAAAAASHGTRVVLNLAPVQALGEQVLSLCDPLVVNEHEAAELLGCGGQQVRSDPAPAARALRDLGPRSVVVTLGESGAWVLDGATSRHVAAPRVDAVDTTGAGDAFVGALATALAEGEDLVTATGWATRYAADTVTRPGAQSSYPLRSDVS